MKLNSSTTTPISIRETNEPSIRRQKYSTNPNRPKMTVNVSESFDELHDLNKKALRILAKRA
ncbi:MAG TPA: hypothetical protein VNU45_07330 [Rummeliibacillus sp.]|nr:hypothetical protein [Rummeliibacillus sp.]